MGDNTMATAAEQQVEQEQESAAFSAGFDSVRGSEGTQPPEQMDDDLYEDDVPSEMKKQCGERVGLIREMVRYGIVKAGTNVFYSGGTTRATVDEKITLKMLRKASRTLQANHAKKITGVLAPSINIGTLPVESAYLVFVSTDAEADVRDLAGFVHVSEYGNRKVVNENEIGSVENFRFITSPNFPPNPATGMDNGIETGMQE